MRHQQQQQQPVSVSEWKMRRWVSDGNLRDVDTWRCSRRVTADAGAVHRLDVFSRQRAARARRAVQWQLGCLVFTNVTSALEVFLNVMRYINPRFTYLLTYLRTLILDPRTAYIRFFYAVLGCIDVRDSGGRGHVPPKIREKYFSGNYYVKFWHFSDKNHVKFGNFVNYYKNSGILLIKIRVFCSFFGQDHVKFGHFVNFSYMFFGQKCRAPKVDWAPRPMLGCLSFSWCATFWDLPLMYCFQCSLLDQPLIVQCGFNKLLSLSFSLVFLFPRSVGGCFYSLTPSLSAIRRLPHVFTFAVQDILWFLPITAKPIPHWLGLMHCNSIVLMAIQPWSTSIKL